MSTTNIITGQFVQLEQTPASLGERILARIIDEMIIYFYVALLSIFLYTFHTSSPFFTVIWYLLYLPAIGYTFLAESMNNGQTLGKYVMKLRVVKVDGSCPSIGTYFMRWMTLFVDIYMSCIGIVFILCTNKRQRIGDLAAGTMVIRINNYQQLHVSLDEFRYARQDYQPVYAEAKQLSFGQAEVIRKTLEGNSQHRPEQIGLLSAKTRQFLNIQPKEKSQEQFLITLLHDYQYFALQLI